MPPTLKKPSPKTAAALLDQYFLEIRCHLLEAAAGFDRIERAEGSEAAMNDPRLRKLIESLDILKSPGGERAEAFLELFSTEGDA